MARGLLDSAGSQVVSGLSHCIFRGTRRICSDAHVPPLVAGALESLSAMAQAHLEIGIASPFLVSHLQEAISFCNYRISLHGSCFTFHCRFEP